MAATEKSEQDVLEPQLQDIVQDLYELMVQAASYDNVGPGVKSRDVLVDTIQHLHTSFLTLSTTATAMLSDSPSNDPTVSTSRDIRIPPELIKYVDAGRNPDIYTREFVELARRGNQVMKGKQAAFAGFRDCLAREMARGLPELREDVERVVNSTGGTWKGLDESQSGLGLEERSK